MDLLTHALLGSQLAQVSAGRLSQLSLRECLLLGATAAAFPDIDFAAFPVDPLRFLADWHQGPTHSLVLLPLWAALLAGAFAALRRRAAVFPQAMLVCAIGLASHIAADLLTVYGTMVLYPLSDWRPSLGTTFVIDPLFTAIVLAGLLLGVRTGRRWIGPATLGLLCAYVAAQAWLQQRALELGRGWARQQGMDAQRVAALPQPFSPFNWKLLVSQEDAHHEAHVNLGGHPPLVPDWPVARPLRPVAAAYLAPQQSAWTTRYRYGEDAALRPLVRQRWEDPRFAPFRRLAAYPAVSRIDHEGTALCIWFTDLRYDLPAMQDTFRYGFCRQDENAAWELYRLRYFSEQARHRLPQ